MRLEQLEKLMAENPEADFREIIQRMNERNSRQSAIFAAEKQVDQDVLICNLMAAWTNSSKLISSAADLCSPRHVELIKALAISRQALELALNVFDVIPVKIRRV